MILVREGRQVDGLRVHPFIIALFGVGILLLLVVFFFVCFLDFLV